MKTFKCIKFLFENQIFYYLIYTFLVLVFYYRAFYKNIVPSITVEFYVK